MYPSKNTQNNAPLFSDFRLSLVEKDSLRALVTCKVGGAIWLSGIRVIEGSKGRFISMPARKSAEGEFQDVFFPVSREVREQLQKEILALYEKQLAAA